MLTIGLILAAQMSGALVSSVQSTETPTRTSTPTVIVASAPKPAALVTNPAAVVLPGAIGLLDMGQSNAACAGELVPGVDDQPDPDIFVVRRDGRTYTSAEPYCGVGGTGYARSLARTLIDQGIAPQVWVIQCAVSGTTIYDWTQNIGDALNTGLQVGFGGSAYRNCIEASLIVKRMGIPIAVVAWHQGETSCQQGVTGPQQTAQLNLVMVRALSDLDNPIFVIGQLAPSFVKVCARTPIIDAANAAAMPDGGDFTQVSSAGLTTAADNTHFNRASLRILGQRYAQQVITILSLRR